MDVANLRDADDDLAEIAQGSSNRLCSNQRWINILGIETQLRASLLQQRRNVVAGIIVLLPQDGLQRRLQQFLRRSNGLRGVRFDGLPNPRSVLMQLGHAHQTCSPSPKPPRASALPSPACCGSAGLPL